jgi:hypothetical protein
VAWCYGRTVRESTVGEASGTPRPDGNLEPFQSAAEEPVHDRSQNIPDRCDLLLALARNSHRSASPDEDRLGLSWKNRGGSQRRHEQADIAAHTQPCVGCVTEEVRVPRLGIKGSSSICV